MRGRFAIASRRLAGWILAGGLLAAAGWWAREPLWAAVSSLTLEDAPPVLGMAVSVAAALVLAAELFGLALRLFPHDPPVSRGRMLRLVAVSAVLNFLPLPRAGAWGRAAYLKAKHGLSLRASLVTLGMVLGVSVAVFAVVAGTLVLTGSFSDAARLSAAAGGVVGLSLACGLVSRAHRRAAPVRGGARPGLGEGHLGEGHLAEGHLWAWPLLRAADLVLGALRLTLACGVVGAPLSLPDALLLASGGLLARLVGLTPNGLGLSEAVVTALAAVLTPLETAVVAAATLLDRVVEVAVVALAAAAARPVGLLGTGRSPEPSSEPSREQSPG